MVSSTSEEETSSVSKTNLDDSDLTLQLPDHILIRILSLFTNIKEAGRTCLISRRWRHLWKSTTRLNFDRPKGLTMVNRVLSLLDRSSLDTFTIEYELNEGGFSRDIDELVKNLIEQKRVKTIELHFKGDSNFKSLLKECNRCFQSLSKLSNTKCLISLALDKVKVDEKFLESLLLNCPNLYKLSVSRSEKLVDLKVSGPPWLNLKHLDISSCQKMENIELSAPMLVSFHYFGRRINFQVGDNPNLSELQFRGGYEEQMISYALGPFSSHLSQLKTLRMKTDLKKRVKEIPKLRNLKHLILDFRLGKYSDGLIGFTSRILLAAPSLNKIVFNLSSQHVTTTKHNGTPDATLFQHHMYLKEVEISGFIGGYPEFEFELAKYLLKVSVNLEKMVVDPLSQNEMTQGKICEPKNMEPRNFYGLKKLLPPGAELVFY